MRISQYMPACNHKGQFNNLHMCVKSSRSATANHLLHDDQCAMCYNKDMFSVLNLALLNLKVLKTIYIYSLKPSLFEQKEWHLGLNVIWL